MTKLDDSIARLPMREAVRYTEKNMKWTASEFNVRHSAGIQTAHVSLTCLPLIQQTHVKNHANAILEFGINSKDNIVVWMPEGAEKV